MGEPPRWYSRGSHPPSHVPDVATARAAPHVRESSVRISAMEYVVAAVILLVVLVVGAVGLVVPRMRRRQLPPPSAGGTTTLERPPAGEAPTAPPILVPETPAGEVPLDELPPLIETPVIEEPQQRFETPEPTAGRLVRLRARLS